MAEVVKGSITEKQPDAVFPTKGEKDNDLVGGPAEFPTDASSTAKTVDPGTGMDSTKDQTSKGGLPSANDHIVGKLGDLLTEKMASALQPMFESVVDTMKGISQGMQLIALKMADMDTAGSSVQKTVEVQKTDGDDTGTGSGDIDVEKCDNPALNVKKNVDTETEIVKSADVLTALETLAQSLVETQNQLVEVAKSVEAQKGITPKQTVRDEQVDVSKSADKENPNTCLDSVFAFLN